MINQKDVEKNLFKYILRLLAGKFSRICTEFPQGTFSTKNSKWLPLNFSACKKLSNSLSFQIALYNCSYFVIKINFSIKDSFFEPFWSREFFAQDDMNILLRYQYSKWQAKQNTLKLSMLPRKRSFSAIY